MVAISALLQKGITDVPGTDDATIVDVLKREWDFIVADGGLVKMIRKHFKPEMAISPSNNESYDGRSGVNSDRNETWGTPVYPTDGWNQRHLNQAQYYSTISSQITPLYASNQGRQSFPIYPQGTFFVLPDYFWFEGCEFYKTCEDYRGAQIPQVYVNWDMSYFLNISI